MLSRLTTKIFLFHSFYLVHTTLNIQLDQAIFLYRFHVIYLQTNRPHIKLRPYEDISLFHELYHFSNNPHIHLHRRVSTYPGHLPYYFANTLHRYFHHSRFICPIRIFRPKSTCPHTQPHLPICKGGVQSPQF